MAAIEENIIVNDVILKNLMEDIKNDTIDKISHMDKTPTIKNVMDIIVNDIIHDKLCDKRYEYLLNNERKKKEISNNIIKTIQEGTKLINIMYPKDEIWFDLLSKELEITIPKVIDTILIIDNTGSIHISKKYLFFIILILMIIILIFLLKKTKTV